VSAVRRTKAAVVALPPIPPEAQLTRALEQIQGIALLTFDAEMRFSSASGGALVSHGYRAQDFLGRRPDELPGTAWQALRDPFAHALAGHRASQSFDFSPDGKTVYKAVVTPLLDDYGRLLGGIFGLRNITAQRSAETALHRSESEFRALSDRSAAMLTRHDARGVYLYASPSAIGVVGYTPEQLVGRHPLEFVHPDDVQHVRATVAQARVRAAVGQAYDRGFEVEHRVLRPDRSCVWVNAIVRYYRDADGELRGVGALRDITAHKLQEARLREATERFERTFEHAPIGMGLIGLDGNWIRVNRALCALLGYSDAELLRKSFKEITHPGDIELSLKAFDGLLDGRPFEGAKRYLHADGHVIWVQLATSVVLDERGAPQHFVAQIQDVTERMGFQERLAHLADHDTLTDLYNRRRFEAELERQVTLAQRYEEDGAALVMLDLDHFKYVNDSLGHRVGDRVIAHVGALLSERLRSTDIVARLGGDEFAIVLPHVDAQRARLLAATLVSAIEERPFEHGEDQYTLSGSAGVVMLDAHTACAEDAMVNADLALYDAKRRGRNRVAVYSPQTRRDAAAGLSWSQRLKHALSHDGFELVAQPIVDLADGQTVIHELLIRMRAEDGTLIAPADFLPAAERFGQLPAIDRWVIARAAGLACEQPGRCLAVNLAAKTIAEPGLVGYIAAQLSACGADPGDLIFELSESDVIANLVHAQETCARLRELGARVALDDFGSGFSSFSYVKALDVDLLKIDGQFVRELASNRVDRLVVQAILHVAGGMGLPTVAEYVVDETVAQTLRKLGVDYGQGFHFGKPAPLPVLL
jgi:diguanylate cyclase (GGDEF)-like protein/PAS domain S-box-containing protein